MTDEIINQAITESTQVETPQPIETPQENTESTATDETPSEEAKTPEDVPFPKKAVNALSRRDKQIGKLQAERAALQAELAKFREQDTKSAQNLPREENFDNYGEYLRAQHRAEWEQEQATKSKQTEEQQASEFHQQWKSEREQLATEKTREVFDKIPDFHSVISEYADVITSLPPYLETAFLELENAPAALYALAKEGRLESLLTMSPARAVMEVGRAEDRGEGLFKSKPVTKAPAPLGGLKAVGGSNRTISGSSSWDDLQKWLAS